MLGGAGAGPKAGVDDRAVLGAGPDAARPLGVQNIAAETPHNLLRAEAEQRCRLWVDVTYAPLAIDAEDTLDDAGDDRLRLSLLVAEIGGQAEQPAAHLFKGRR